MKLSRKRLTTLVLMASLGLAGCPDNDPVDDAADAVEDAADDAGDAVEEVVDEVEDAAD